LPDQSTLLSKGITDTLKIIEYFPGNSSTDLPAWINREYNISLVNTASISEVSAPNVILSDDTASIDFELRFDNGGSVIDNISFNSFEIYNDSDASLVCSDTASCVNAGFNVSFPGGTVTDGSGIVTMDVQMLTSPSVIRGIYWVNVTADTDPQYSNTPIGGTSFDIVWNNATIVLDMVPLNVMKPHESKSINATLTSDYDNTPISGRQMDFELTFKSNSSFVCNTFGGCLIRGFNITSSNVTDANGQVIYTLTTNYLIVGDANYTFTVTPTNPFNPDSAPLFITNSPAGSVDVMIDRDPKIGMLEFLGNLPDNTTVFRPTESVNLEFRTKTDKNATYPNVPIIVELWNMSGVPSIISNGTGNLWYYSPLISDVSGFIYISLNSTSVNTPTGSYRLNVTADFTSFLGIDQYLQNSYSTPYLYNFTIDDQYDGINYLITAVPSATTQPLPGGGSMVDININLQRSYNASWQSYNGPQSPTPIQNMRVKPIISLSPGISWSISLVNFPESDISGYYYTNASGHLTITVKSIYPFTYENITKIVGFELSIVHNSTEPSFLSYFNSTQGMYVKDPTFQQLLSIDPDYNIIDVFSVSPAYDWPGGTFPLGSAMELYFETRNGTFPLFNVPVRFEITSGALSGLYLMDESNNPIGPNDHVYSDGSGQITIKINSTYGVTIETASQLQIEITATANV
ncbi:MAG: hypothetical protein ACW99A_23930, partial [Candidatus Kariarchaeaceae archaeon]